MNGLVREIRAIPPGGLRKVLPWSIIKCVRNKAASLESQGFQGSMALFKCKVFAQICAKTLHLPQERYAAPVGIRIVTMSEFHKIG